MAAGGASRTSAFAIIVVARLGEAPVLKLGESPKLCQLDEGVPPQDKLEERLQRIASSVAEIQADMAAAHNA